MFCGAGKSFVIYHCLLEFGDNLSVVIPSINLITQFNRDYLLDKDKHKHKYNKNEFKFKKEFKLITICSKNELLDTKTDFVFTTEDEEITEFLDQENDKIILITYQSLEKTY
jgi:superfamily II DNA or RNA helicase